MFVRLSVSWNRKLVVSTSEEALGPAGRGWYNTGVRTPLDPTARPYGSSSRTLRIFANVILGKWSRAVANEGFAWITLVVNKSTVIRAVNTQQTPTRAVVTRWWRSYIGQILTSYQKLTAVKQWSIRDCVPGVRSFICSRLMHSKSMNSWLNV